MSLLESRRKSSSTAENRAPESKIPSAAAEKGEYQHNNLLLAALTPSLLILFLFGGKEATITIAFGAIIVYIFDILGALEATLLALFIAIGMLWISLIYASRFILRESLLHLSISGIFGTTLLYLYLILAGYFNAIRTSFEGTIYITEKIMFATIPILSAAIISWFLCLQLPTLDLSLCFSTVYCLYLYIVAAPRSSWCFSAYASSEYILTKLQITSLYITPIVIGPLLHIALHHNVLATTTHRIANFLLSILVPILGVLLNAETQLAYWSTTTATHLEGLISAGKIASSIGLVICLQSHQFFDDLKTYSGYHEPLSSLLVIGITLFSAIAMYINQRYVKTLTIRIREDFTQSSQSPLSQQLLKADILENACIIAAAFLMGQLLRLGTMMFMFCTLCVRINFFLSRSSHRARIKARGIFFFATAVTAFFVVLSFGVDTLGNLSFTFKAPMMEDIPMDAFICAVAILMAFSVTLPSNLPNETAHKQSLDLSEGSTVGQAPVGPSMYFDVMYIYSVVKLALIEVLVREQNWSIWGTDVEVVYPSYLLFCTAILLITPSIFLYLQGSHTLTGLWIVIVFQAAKLSCIFGVSSSYIVCTTVLVVSYTAPFFQGFSVAALQHSFKLHKVPSKHSDLASLPVGNTSAGGTPTARFIGSVVGTGLVSIWAQRTGLVHQAIDSFYARDTPFLKEICALLALYSFYVSMMLMVYYPLSHLRSVSLLISFVAAVVATESLHTLSDDGATSILSSLQPQAAAEHAPFFIVVCVLLASLASVGILPIKQPLTRLAYILAFTFCGTMAIYGVSFTEPLPLLFPDRDTFLNHVFLNFTWLHCFVLSLFGTSVALHLAAASGKKSGVIPIFGLFIGAPFVMWSIAFFLNFSTATLNGIAFSTAIACALLACSVAFVTQYFRAGHTRNLNASMVAALSSLFCIAWTFVFSLYSHHNADFLIPLATLTLLTIPKGHLLKDTPPMATILLACTLWWGLSAFYAIFLKGITTVHDYDGVIPKHIPYQDINISFFNQKSVFLPILNFILVLVPLPAIITAYLRRKGESEDMVFICAIFSSVALFGGQIWCIRLNGLVGVVYGFWWCYDLSIMQQKSDALL